MGIKELKVQSGKMKEKKSKSCHKSSFILQKMVDVGCAFLRFRVTPCKRKSMQLITPSLLQKSYTTLLVNHSFYNSNILKKGDRCIKYPAFTHGSRRIAYDANSLL